MMEVLAGARDDQREADLRRLLRRFHLLRFDPVSDFDAAVHIYRRCRSHGVTPRGCPTAWLPRWRGGQTRRCWRRTPTLPGWPELSASRSAKRPVAPRFPAMTTVGLVGTGSMGSARGAGLRQSRSARSASGRHATLGAAQAAAAKEPSWERPAASVAPVARTTPTTASAPTPEAQILPPRSPLAVGAFDVLGSRRRPIPSPRQKRRGGCHGRPPPGAGDCRLVVG